MHHIILGYLTMNSIFKLRKVGKCSEILANEFLGYSID